jgi:hypothetical protein
VSTSPLSRAGRGRRRQRGAVLVESIIVSVLLMTFLASGLFLHRLYVEQHKAIEQARLAAWSQALPGCHAAVDFRSIWESTGATDAQLDVETDMAPAFFGGVGHTSGSASQEVRAHERLGGGTYTLSATDTVACNEVAQPKGRNIKTLLGYITSNVIPNLF